MSLRDCFADAFLSHRILMGRSRVPPPNGRLCSRLERGAAVRDNASYDNPDRQADLTSPRTRPRRTGCSSR
jgi:hypothetical protein